MNYLYSALTLGNRTRDLAKWLQTGMNPGDEVTQGTILEWESEKDCGIQQ